MSADKTQEDTKRSIIPPGAVLIHEDDVCRMYSMICPMHPQTQDDLCKKTDQDVQEEDEEYLCHREDLNIFQLWVLPEFSEEEVHSRFCNHALIDGKHGISTVTQYLMCRWTKDLHTSLRTFMWIQTKISGFVAAVLVIDYLRQCDEDTVLEFHRLSRDRLCKAIYDVIDLYTFFRKQQAVLMEYPERTRLNVSAAISKTTSAQKDESKVSSCLQLLSSKAYMCSLDISVKLLEMAIAHVKDQTLLCNDNIIMASRYFEDFVMCYVTQLPKKHPSAMQVLLWCAQTHCVATTLFHVRSGDGDRFPLNLHTFLLDGCGCKYPELPLDVEAKHSTKDDCLTFLEILYRSEEGDINLKMVDSKVTLGVAEIAKGIGIQDVWGFILRRYDFDPSNCLQDNPEDLLPILFLLERYDEIDKIMQEKSCIFHGHDICRLVPKLRSEQIVAIVNSKMLAWPGIQKYKALIRWAYSVIGKPCPRDPLLCNKDLEVMEQFRHVRQSLPLQDMRCWWGKLLKLGYITTNDLSM